MYHLTFDPASSSCLPEPRLRWRRRRVCEVQPRCCVGTFHRWYLKHLPLQERLIIAPSVSWRCFNSLHCSERDRSPARHQYCSDRLLTFTTAAQRKPQDIFFVFLFFTLKSASCWAPALLGGPPGCQTDSRRCSLISNHRQI